MCEGGNSDLKYVQWVIPKGIRKYLKKVLDDYDGDKTISGYDRLRNLLDMDYVSYQEMKRLKNFFDNYEGTDKSNEYKLNGGDIMKSWVTTTLNRATKAIKDRKQHLKDTGVKNAFRNSSFKFRHNNEQGKKGKTKKLKFDDEKVKKENDAKQIKYESLKRNNCIVITENQAKQLFIIK